MTQLYPNNDRKEWVWEFLEAPVYRNGFLCYSYSVWPTQASKDKGDAPFLLNSHSSQMRATHQRIIRNPQKELAHASGIYVPKDEVSAFLRTDSRAYTWEQKTVDEWKDTRNRTLKPFLFAGYWGREDQLDPQWLREEFTLPLADQVVGAINRYLRLAAIHGWSGDRRGTTLNLQVGQSSDDGSESSSTTTENTAANIFTAANNTWGGAVFDPVNVAQGQAIDTAIFSLNLDLLSGQYYDEPYDRLKINDVDDAATITAGAFNSDISGRTYDAVDYADWDVADLGSSDGDWEEWGAASAGASGTNIKDMVEAVNVDRGGWSSGGAMMFGWAQITTDAARELRSHTYDSSSAEAPKLDLTHTAGVAVAVGTGLLTGLKLQKTRLV